ncbi:GNAT family N-acetyltransferase [Flavobacterium sp.]|uniref:GNAT family N-acetyltransferase n=1 Tax=Flavobacterium sp. TaxID=239 RepID=UPI003D125944
MKKILETPRLYLRELKVTDAEDFFLLNQDPEVIRYTGDVAFNHISEAVSFLQNYNPYELYDYGRWAVIRKEDNAFLGWCGLKYSSDLDEVDVGFRFFKKYWNQGYATESAKASLHYGFETLHLNKIVGRAMKANSASIKVLEKIGMKYTGTFDFMKHEGVLYEIQK